MDEVNKHIPPPGIKTDYDSVFAVGHNGIINKETAIPLLFAQLDPRFEKINQSIEQSISYLRKQNRLGDFAFSFIALQEVLEIYPMTQSNWHSGERIPLAHSSEVIPNSLILCFQSNYKTAFQNLREFLELCVLQIYFYVIKDKEIIGKWGRGEIWTPNFKRMLTELSKNEFFSSADSIFNIKDSLTNIYDDLGAYIHTRGVPATIMGLSGSNINTFSESSLEKYLKLFWEVAHIICLLLSIFFPNGIIALPSFDKLGHWHPTWLPRQEKIDSIRKMLTREEITFIENVSKKNSWFLRLREKINSLPDLSAAEIEKSYQEVNKLAQRNMEDFVKKLKEYNKILEV